MAILGAVAALTVAACSGPPPAASPVAAPTSATGAAAGEMPGPGSVVRRPLDHAAMDAVVERTATELRQPGMVVLVRTPQDEYVNTRGVTEVRGSTPVTLDTTMRIGSNTKTMTGTAILQMVQEGKIALSDPVSTYLPDVPGGEAITIAQLGDMRSGLFNYTETVALNTALDTEPGRVWTDEELLALAFANPPYFAPGQGWHYSNTNTVLLGRIVEQLTGNSLETEITQRVLDRSGMAESSFPTSSAALPDPHPTGYTYGTNVETVDTNVLSAEKQAAARAGTLAPMDVTFTNPSWAWSAGAGISTAGDLTRYLPALVGGGLLSPELQKTRLESTRPVDPTDPQSPGYGLALARFGPMYGHTGELPGYNTFTGYDPDRKISVVVWTSLAPSPDGRDPAAQMARTVIGELYGMGG